jgi:sulfoxide reductase catalytic subunit YedY
VKSRPSWWIPESEITPESTYVKRRELLRGLGFIGASQLLSGAIGDWAAQAAEASTTGPSASGRASASSRGLSASTPRYPRAKKFDFKDPERPMTEERLVTSHNNFYEFSLQKSEVAGLAQKWTPPSPWKIQVAGLVEQPMELDLEDIMKRLKLEERVYRFRCVEAWSMVVPWGGFQLRDLLQICRPKPSAKFVKFVTYQDERAMPNIKGMPHYPWPYTEGLSLAEAQHELTFMATAIYGKNLPQQNGAPLRLVVPWKYGFKSIKSIHRIEFTDSQPKTLWVSLAPLEYGFLANVNPEVDHPRWTQKRETRLDGSFFPKKIPTLMFNGYANEVAALYKGVDLKKNY